MTDTEKVEYERVIGELATKLQEAVDEIDRLRAVVAKVTGTDDAHSTLRRLYLDDAQNPNTRVRAAQAALNVEKASLKPVAPPLDLTAEPYEPLADKVRRMRAYVDAMAPKLIEQTARDNEAAARAWRNSGNGGGDNNSND
jgi:hypothetical protein